MEMINIVESTIEQLKSFSYDKTKEDEYLFDMQLISLMNELVDKESVVINLPLDKNSKQWKYICTIYKEEKAPNFWEIIVSVSFVNNEKRVNDVTIQAFMPIPPKQENK